MPRPQSSPSRLLVAVFALFLSSQLAFSIGPVPISAQTLVVFWLGAVYPRSVSVLSVTAWLGLGAIGLPVFAELNGGLDVLTGPSGGYLLAFVPAVVAIGYAVEREAFASFVGASLGFLAATAFVLLCGASWLATHIGWTGAWEHGVEPFLIGGLIKVVIGAAALPWIRAATQSLREG